MNTMADKRILGGVYIALLRVPVGFAYCLAKLTPTDTFLCHYNVVNHSEYKTMTFEKMTG
jgi:hypothetical protein